MSRRKSSPPKPRTKVQDARPLLAGECPPSTPRVLGPAPYVPPPPLEQPEVEVIVSERILDGATPYAAGRAAGLSAPGAGLAVARRPAVRSALLQALEARGIGETRISEVIEQGLAATRPDTVTRQGDVVLGGPDHGTRHKFLGTLLQLRGDLDQDARGEGDTWEAMLIAVRARRLSRAGGS
jgi:hypothetical protein